MTVQAIHEFIWDKVIDYVSTHRPKLGDEHDYVYDVKRTAINELRSERKISYEAKRFLLDYCACVMCAVYSNKPCSYCPVFALKRCNCHERTSDYSYTRFEFNKESAERIRNVDVLSGKDPNRFMVLTLEQEEF